MKTNEQTQQQIERAIHKIADKFPSTEEAVLMTDIHIRVTQETGELIAFDDDDKEITRCVVEQWINNTDENFYQEITPVIKKCINKVHTTVETMSVLKPFSFVLEDDDKESISELYLVDDDTVIIDPDLMENLEDDLNDFLKQLLKDY